MLVVGFIVYAVVMFLVQVLGMTFYGGMFEMVIGAYKGSRNVVFGDLFSGFRKFGSYALYALVLFGISIGLNLLNIIPFIGGIISLVVMIWISVIWLYVLPLIADQGLGFGEAASRSNQMVKGAGWWWTFGMVILLGLAALAAAIVILLVAWGVYQGSDVAGIIIGLLLFLVFAVLFPPYTICYVSVLYIGSGGDLAVAAAAGRRASRHPAGASGASGLRCTGAADLRHAGLANVGRTGPRRSAARRRRRLEGGRGPARRPADGSAAHAGAVRAAAGAAGRPGRRSGGRRHERCDRQGRRGRSPDGGHRCSRGSARAARAAGAAGAARPGSAGRQRLSRTAPADSHPGEAGGAVRPRPPVLVGRGRRCAGPRRRRAKQYAAPRCDASQTTIRVISSGERIRSWCRAGDRDANLVERGVVKHAPGASDRSVA